MAVVFRSHYESLSRELFLELFSFNGGYQDRIFSFQPQKSVLEGRGASFFRTRLILIELNERKSGLTAVQNAQVL
jgi:hypothetical protein